MERELDWKLLSVGRLDGCSVQGVAEAMIRTWVVDTLRDRIWDPAGFVAALNTALPI